MSEIDIVNVGINSLGSFLIGGICGAITRNMFKVMAFLIGTQIVFFTYMAKLNIIKIQWTSIETKMNIVKRTIINIGRPDDVESPEFINGASVIGGFVLGFIIGFKSG